MILCALFCGTVTSSAAVPAKADSTTVDGADAKNAAQDVITPPEYDGGLQKMYDFILDNFEFPEESKKRNVRGKVEIEFTIEKSGDISSVSIISGLDTEVDKELVRVFKAMPMWTPATKNGMPVRYKVTMPISLKLSRVNKNGFR